jgi:RHS repeat-associated protein
MNTAVLEAAMAMSTAHVCKNWLASRRTAPGVKRRLLASSPGLSVRKSREPSGFAAYPKRSRPQRSHFDGSTTYSYDLNGNRTMAGYSTGTDNRLTFDGTYTYTYNAEGDLTQKVSTTATWTFGWDNMNRLVGVKEVTTTGTQLSVSYSYDVLNNRVEDDTWKPGTGTVTVRYAYDGNNIWADVTTTNTLLARYVYGDGGNQVWGRAIPAGLTNSGVGWYLTDRQGSVRDIMDASSVIVDHADYDGFGNATHTTLSVADQFGYAGGLYSYDTKMEQFGRRWYDPATGRWVSEDPSGFGGRDQNLYRYCGNGPTDGTDPSGLDWHLGQNSVRVTGDLEDAFFLDYYWLPVTQPQRDLVKLRMVQAYDTVSRAYHMLRNDDLYFSWRARMLGKGGPWAATARWVDGTEKVPYEVEPRYGSTTSRRKAYIYIARCIMDGVKDDVWNAGSIHVIWTPCSKGSDGAPRIAFTPTYRGFIHVTDQWGYRTNKRSQILILGHELGRAYIPGFTHEATGNGTLNDVKKWDDLLLYLDE